MWKEEKLFTNLVHYDTTVYACFYSYIHNTYIRTYIHVHSHTHRYSHIHTYIHTYIVYTLPPPYLLHSHTSLIHFFSHTITSHHITSQETSRTNCRFFIAAKSDSFKWMSCVPNKREKQCGYVLGRVSCMPAGCLEILSLLATGRELFGTYKPCPTQRLTPSLNTVSRLLNTLSCRLLNTLSCRFLNTPPTHRRNPPYIPPYHNRYSSLQSCKMYSVSYERLRLAIEEQPAAGQRFLMEIKKRRESFVSQLVLHKKFTHKSRGPPISGDHSPGDDIPFNIIITHIPSQ